VKPSNYKLTYYRYRDFAELGIPFSRQHLNAMAKTGRFPRPRKLLNGTLQCSRADVDAWLAGRNTAGSVA
jgi:predicted DNA-binding transcriptional regulator AlpA